ncbi:B3 domain-containing protein At4g01580-like [Lolium perenne]|uniref:B3 domain-containing protein At4g01580-like n=1 Tax=Lolium perenne TaxID=4522 RepID=UPI003A9A64AD
MACVLVVAWSPQTPEEGRSKKRRTANIGHYQSDVGPNQFLRIIFKPTFSRLRIPHDFVRWFGEIPSNIILKTNTDCNWRMTTAREGDEVYIDQGWVAFAIAHQLQVGQFLIFKRVSSFEYSVVIFEHTCSKVMTRCGYHGDATSNLTTESKQKQILDCNQTTGAPF